MFEFLKSKEVEIAEQSVELVESMKSMGKNTQQK